MQTNQPTRTHPLSQAEYGRRVGRGRSAINEACAGPLKAAMLPGGRIDALQAAALEYAQRCGLDREALLAPATGRQRATPQGTKASWGLEQTVEQQHQDTVGPPLDSYLGLTLREITDRHGSVTGFADWLLCRKRLADAHQRELQNDVFAGKLIHREFVQVHLLGLIDATNLRMLRDLPTTAVVSLYALARSGATTEEGKQAMHDMVSAILRNVKEKAVRAIRAQKAHNAKQDDADEDHQAADDGRDKAARHPAPARTTRRPTRRTA